VTVRRATVCCYFAGGNDFSPPAAENSEVAAVDVETAAGRSLTTGAGAWMLSCWIFIPPTLFRPEKTQPLKITSMREGA